MRNRDLDSVSIRKKKMLQIRSKAVVLKNVERRRALHRIRAQRYTVSVNVTIEITDHEVSISDLELKYGTNVNLGLLKERSARLLSEYGPNIETQKKKIGKHVNTFFANSVGGFSIVLISCLLFCLVVFIINKIQPHNVGRQTQSIILIIYIFIILMMHGLINAIHEIVNERVTNKFNQTAMKYVQILRNGMWRTVPVERLVPGEIVKLVAGDYVPADIRILKSYNLKVDNSSITGASIPQSKSHVCTDENPIETANLLWQGTGVMEGQCKGLVIATGAKTLLGKIEASSSNVPDTASTFRTEIDQFTTYITIQAVAIAILVLVFGFVKNHTPYWVFLNFVGTLIANLPETLNITVIIIQRLCLNRMMKSNILVNRLRAIEILGQIDVVCMDKTGTITESNMTVSHLFYDDAIHNVLSDEYISGTSANFSSLCRIGTLCTTAFGNNIKMGMGDAFDVAMIKCIHKLTPKQMTLDYPKIFEIPASATNKMYVSLHKQPKNDHILQVVKGEPDRIIELCETIIISEEVYLLTDVHYKRLNNIILELGALGERILALADMKLPARFSSNYPFTHEPNFPTTGLRFVGFISFIDPSKEDVPETIQQIKKAGLKTIMLTGDHPVTGLAMARKIGLISSGQETIYDITRPRERSGSISNIDSTDKDSDVAAIYTGYELQKIGKKDLEHILQTHDELVFARISPDQKAFIVEQYQKLGETVMMIGDGVNDAIALRKANVGIAMGKLGATISKKAADVILLKDEFSATILAIKEGRLFYNNIRKTITCTMSSYIPKVIPFLVQSLLDLPSFTSITTILLIILVTDVMPGISMATASPEKDTLGKTNKPEKGKRSNSNSLMPVKLILHCFFWLGTAKALAGIATWFYAMSQYGFLPLHLIGIRKKWVSDSNDILDSYGFEWSRDSRFELDRIGASAYFLAVVIMQGVNFLFVSNTYNSYDIKHGIRNVFMLKTVIVQIVISLCVVYIPYLNRFLGFGQINIILLWPAFLFGLYIFVFSQVRKSIVRTYPDGWMAFNTY